MRQRAAAAVVEAQKKFAFHFIVDGHVLPEAASRQLCHRAASQGADAHRLKR
jgi:hypothetical protein